jgi:hypothetical protein
MQRFFVTVLDKVFLMALLPHTIILKTPRNSPESGVFFDGEHDEITLYNVRVEQNEKVRQSKSGENRTRGAKLYYDCINSMPANIEFNTSQLVDFCGVTYKIEAIKTVMAANKIHHYRIEVI